MLNLYVKIMKAKAVIATSKADASPERPIGPLLRF